MSSGRGLRPRQSRDFVERRRRRLIVGAVAALVSLITWGFVVSWLSYSASIVITTVEVYGDELLAPAIRAAVFSAIDGNYLGLFSRGSIVTISKNDIERAVASTSPRIDTVSVSRKGLHTLSVSVSLRSPDAVVCADLPDVTETDIPMSKHCYLTDQDGYLYRLADDPDASNYTRYYIPSIPDAGALGSQATTSAAFLRLKNLTRSIESVGIHVRAMLIGDRGLYEIYAENPGGESVVVIQMNERAGLETEIANLAAFWNKSIIDSRTSKKLPSWSEIKLQFPPNVYSRQ